MKKLLIALLTLLMILFCTSALAEQTVNAPLYTEPVYLDYSTIIHGDLLYYSGSVDGGEHGIYVMSADGSDARLISNADAELLALSGSNLLIYQYATETDEAVLSVLRPDGSMIDLGNYYGGKAIAANGRFYWGFSSCAEDGSDIQYYFDPASAENADYYPLTVHEGYLYYLDWSEMSEVAYAEGVGQPMGASLCRLNLTDRSVETISALGTHFLGIEDNLIYYTRNNFWYEIEYGLDSAEYKVDEGLFCADLVTLHEKRLASYPTNYNILDSYMMVENGVVYGIHSDYSTNENGNTSIIRIQKDGTRLADIALDSDAISSLSWIDGNMLYLAQSTFTITEDDFIQEDCIVAINLETNERTILNPDSMDMLFYSESDPAIAISGDKIYFSAYDMERWALCLKSMNLDGSDLKLLAYGISYAEG